MRCPIFQAALTAFTKRGGGRGGRGGGGRSSGGGRQPSHYSEVTKKNENFEKYYNELDILEDDEREAFWTALRRELPNSFRFTGSKGYLYCLKI